MVSPNVFCQSHRISVSVMLDVEISVRWVWLPSGEAVQIVEYELRSGIRFAGEQSHHHRCPAEICSGGSVTT